MNVSDDLHLLTIEGFEAKREPAKDELPSPSNSMKRMGLQDRPLVSREFKGLGYRLPGNLFMIFFWCLFSGDCMVKAQVPPK